MEESTFQRSPKPRGYRDIVVDIIDLERTRERFEIAYKITKTVAWPIGSGSRGDVYEGDMNGRRVAVKVIRAKPREGLKANKRLVRELLIWSHLNHDYIAPLYGLTYDQEFGHGITPGIVSLFIEYDLMEYTFQHPEEKLRIIHECALGMRYSHAHMVIHGDLKPDNVRVAADGHAKIIDFGMGKVEHVRGYTSVWNPNPRYFAPELLSVEGAIRPTFKSDVYSFAMLMLQVLHGRDFQIIDADAEIEIDASMPFNDLPNDSLFGLLRLCDAVTHGRRPLKDQYRNITPRQWELLESCWHDDPRERPPMSRIVEHLEQS